jgi:hypothetical protein
MADSTSTGNDNTRTLVKREIKLIGDKSSCSACDSGDQFFSSVKKPNLDYKYIDINSPEGNSKFEQTKTDYMPIVEDCKTYSNGETKCETKNRFAKEDWTDLTNDSTTTS